jgi:type IV pilus assembly protein PilE
MNNISQFAKREKGFSLVEILVVVTIVAILTAVAVPSYSEHVRKQKRNFSKVQLHDIINRQNQYLADNRQYANNLTLLGYSSATYGITGNGSYVAADSTEAIYTIGLTNTSNYTYTVIATPVNSQASDSACGTLSITSAGAYSATGSHGNDCW